MQATISMNASMRESVAIHASKGESLCGEGHYLPLGHSWPEERVIPVSHGPTLNTGSAHQLEVEVAQPSLPCKLSIVGQSCKVHILK